MGGTDAAGGFAYQHAQAIEAALRLVDEPGLAYVRVEAENDAIDLEIWSESDELVEAFQFKRRSDNYTWGQGELLKLLKEWVGLGSDNPAASFAFVTDGRLGRTGRTVRDALKSAANGDFSAIETLLPGPLSTPGRNALGRASIIVDDAVYTAIIARSEKRAIALIPNVSGAAEAEERGRGVVLELLNSVTERSGDANPDNRIITKEEVWAYLCTPLDRIKTLSWGKSLKNTFLSSIISNEPSRLLELSCLPIKRDSAGMQTSLENGISKSRKDMEARRLEDFVSSQTICVLGGGTGSGKSSTFRMMQSRLAANGEVAILLDAEDYITGRLGALVSSGLNRYEYIGAYPAIGNAVLTDPSVTLIIDGVSEVPQPIRDGLKEEIRSLLAASQRPKLILGGRDATVLRSMVPRKNDSMELLVERLNTDRRRELLSTVFRIPPAQVEAVVRKMENDLGDVADNPMMLLHGLRASAVDPDAVTPARIMRTMVRIIATDTGYSNATEYEIGLGVAFSKLLDQGKRYSDSYGWIELVSNVAAELSQRGHLLSGADLAEFGRETGLVHISQFDRVQPLHDAFADYLSAAALQRSASKLPPQLGRHDRVRVTYLAELAGIGKELARRVISDLPFTAVLIASREDRHDADSTWLQETREYVDLLLPESEPKPRIAFWVDDSGRRVVTFNGGYDGWWEDCGPADVSDEGRTLALNPGQGPIYVAIRIWHWFLRKTLSSKDRLTSAAPINNAETVEMLSSYSRQLQNAMNKLVTAIGIEGVDGEPLKEAASKGLQIYLSEATANSIEQRERPVKYRDVAGLRETDDRVLCSSKGDSEIWSGYGRVDSFLNDAPFVAACNDLKDDINRMVGWHWL